MYVASREHTYNQTPMHVFRLLAILKNIASNQARCRAWPKTCISATWLHGAMMSGNEKPRTRTKHAPRVSDMSSAIYPTIFSSTSEACTSTILINHLYIIYAGEQQTWDHSIIHMWYVKHHMQSDKNIEQYKTSQHKRKLQREPWDSLRLQPPDCVNGVPPLPFLQESAWCCWLRTGSHRTGQEDHIRPGAKEEGWTVDKAP